MDWHYQNKAGGSLLSLDPPSPLYSFDLQFCPFHLIVLVCGLIQLSILAKLALYFAGNHQVSQLWAGITKIRPVVVGSVLILLPHL
jgi:hypothetical protein